MGSKNLDSRKRPSCCDLVIYVFINFSKSVLPCVSGGFEKMCRYDRVLGLSVKRLLMC